MQTLPAGRHLQFLHSSLAEQKSSALGRESSQSHPEEGFENTNPKNTNQPFFRHLQFLHFSFAPQKLSALGRLSSQSHPESFVKWLCISDSISPPCARHLHCLQVWFLGQKLSAFGRDSSQSHPGSKSGEFRLFVIEEHQTFWNTLALLAFWISGTKLIRVCRVFVTIASWK